MNGGAQGGDECVGVTREGVHILLRALVHTLKQGGKRGHTRNVHRVGGVQAAAALVHGAVQGDNTQQGLCGLHMRSHTDKQRKGGEVKEEDIRIQAFALTGARTH